MICQELLYELFEAKLEQKLLIDELVKANLSAYLTNFTL